MQRLTATPTPSLPKASSAEAVLPMNTAMKDTLVPMVITTISGTNINGEVTL